MFGLFGGWELLIILFVVLVIFGPTRLPKIARSMGKTVKEVSKIRNDVDSIKSSLDEEDDENE